MGYLFDPHELHEITKRHLGLPHEVMMERLIADLAERYPGYIETKQNWLFNMAGGAMGVMTLLHGSLSEYLLIYGTSIGTEGFSGRYWLDIWDYILAGEVWNFSPDEFWKREVSNAGTMCYLPHRTAKGYRIPDQAWMLEYGRGWVPTALPFGIGDALLTRLDFKTVFKTIWLYSKLVMKSLWKGKI